MINYPNGVKATLEIPRDDIGRQRLFATYDEIVDYGVFLQLALGKSVTLVTRDYSAEICARRAGLDVVYLDDKWSKGPAGVAT